MPVAVLIQLPTPVSQAMRRTIHRLEKEYLEAVAEIYEKDQN
jgi:hypothetical protein